MNHVKAVIPSARETHPSARTVVRRSTKAEVGPMTFLSGLSVPLKGMNVSVLCGVSALQQITGLYARPGRVYKMVGPHALEPRSLGAACMHDHG